MGFSPDRQTIYPMLEGTVVGDPRGSLRIYKFDVASSQYKGLVGRYQLSSPNNALGDLTPVNDHEFLLIERDNLQGSSAAFKKIFKLDFSQVNANGFVAKQEVVNLLTIQDPNDLNGDGSNTYTMPFQTIEDVLVLDSKTILVANDNNYPFSIGRPPNLDNNEMVVIELDQSLALDNRLGTAAAIAEASQLVSGTPGNDTAIANDSNSNVILDGINDTVFTGAGNDEVDTTFAINSPLSRGNRINTGSGQDVIFANNGDRVNGGSGNDELDATDASGYRLSGGAGDDWFYLGENGRAIGGDGDN
jgi:glycerophosphoryl diester phosphodiesterase